MVKFCGFQLDVGQLKRDNKHSFTNETLTDRQTTLSETYNGIYYLYYTHGKHTVQIIYTSNASHTRKNLFNFSTLGKNVGFKISKGKLSERD